ncbi:MAG: DUF448 domain-containing protein [Alphaproteobacteria bacterium]|jgi:predicted RNA-binding protein YlxR (DUF448 family)|nr:DUF448 domain-containing protein [Alphaproteobacteria bacterium]
MAKELDITRKCILTGQILPKAELLRFVLLKDGHLVPDFNKKLEGRGIYISNSLRLLQGLTVKSPLNKILHTNVIIDADLPQMVEKILYHRGLEAINLARKAGDLVLGFEQVKEMLKKGKVAFVIEAKDAGGDGGQKMTAMTAAAETEKFNVYDIAALSKALDRENTVYLAVKTGKAAPMVRQAMLRYQTYMNG